MVKKEKKYRIIGWREKIDLPEFGLTGVDAKIDTGARTSVIHCSHIEQVKKFRKNYVKFIPLDPSFRNYTGKEFVLPYHGERKVKNSFGHEENRFIVLTRIRMFGKTFNIELSLRDRANLEFPVLLGRTAIRKRFLVDVTRSDQSFKHQSRKKSRKAKTS